MGASVPTQQDRHADYAVDHIPAEPARSGATRPGDGSAKSDGAVWMHGARRWWNVCLALANLASIAHALRRDLPLQQRSNLRLAVTPVAAKSADCAKFARLRPPGHGLRVDSEHRRNLGRRQKRLRFVRTRCHRSLLHRYPITKAGVPAGRRHFMVRPVPDVRHGPNGWRSLYGWMMNRRIFPILIGQRSINRT